MDGPYLATAVSNHHNLIVFIIKIYDILSPNHTGGYHRIPITKGAQTQLPVEGMGAHKLS